MPDAGPASPARGDGVTLPFDEFVLAAATADLSVADRSVVRECADAVEFRMDLAAPAAPAGAGPGTGEVIDALDAYDAPLPVLATDRLTREGGESPAGPARVGRLCRAARHPAVAAVDVELSALRRADAADDGHDATDDGHDTDPGAGGDSGPGTADGPGPGEDVAEDATAVLDAARAAGTAVVVSTHDFGGTPDREAMAELLRAACARGDVGKLAVTAETADDALSVLAVTRELAGEGRRVATMAMGEAGRHTRAVAPVYGSRVGYAPADPADATAPGQYDLATLSELVERLR